MSTRDKILQAAKAGPLKASQLSKRWSISRQTITEHLRKLVQEGKLIREGHTRGAIYHLPGKEDRARKEVGSLNIIKDIMGLTEDKVFQEVDLKLRLKSKMNANVYSIAAYAFTEMLNNAIEHSRGSKVYILVQVNPRTFDFEIKDRGIGIFRNVLEKFRFTDEFVALEHILKGKQTTAPEAHSGEGIFFTSRISDRFVIRSHSLRLTVDNEREDCFVAEERFIKGTTVNFSILVRSKKKLNALFEQFTDEQYHFNKGVVRIKVSSFGGALSRSQARRLLFGLEKYKKLVLDFSGVKEMGQGFADEIFGVYASAHSQFSLDYAHAVPAIEFMIKRAKATRTD